MKRRTPGIRFYSPVYCTKIPLGTYHLSLSFNVGGLKPLFDIRNNARIGCKSNIGGCSSASSMAVIPIAQISHN